MRAFARAKSDERGRLNYRSTLAAIVWLTHVLLGAPAVATDELVGLAMRVVDSLDIDVVALSQGPERWRPIGRLSFSVPRRATKPSADRV